MMYLLVCTVALIASILTFFAGFGLGTLLMPAMVLFFEPKAAIAMTAVVHLLNGLLKFSLVARFTRWNVALKFGAPAIAAAFVGAGCLKQLARQAPLFSYQALNRTHDITLIKLVMALLMVGFALLELSKRWQAKEFSPQLAPFGGLLSGFFGGLSGHQGALRAAFLVRFGLTKEAFVATSAFISTSVDLTRLSVYGFDTQRLDLQAQLPLLMAATASAFAGVIIGNRLLKKVTLAHVQRTVTAMLVVVALGLATGFF